MRIREGVGIEGVVVGPLGWSELLLRAPLQRAVARSFGSWRRGRHHGLRKDAGAQTWPLMAEIPVVMSLVCHVGLMQHLLTMDLIGQVLRVLPS